MNTEKEVTQFCQEKKKKNKSRICSSLKIKYMPCNYVKNCSSKNEAMQNLKYLLHKMY